MAETYVAVDGAWRKVNTSLVAVDGLWRASNTGLIAVEGLWRAGYLPGPKVTLAVAHHPSAPWSRLSYSYTAQGTWAALRVVVGVVGGTWQQVLASYGAASQATVSETNVMTPMVLWPTGVYYIQIEWYDSSGRWFVADRKDMQMAALPKVDWFNPPKNVTMTGYTLDWGPLTDVDVWNSRNDTLGTNWTHAGNLSYISYSSGLTASTNYYNYTRPGINGTDQWGPWSDAQVVRTLDKQWTPGVYYYNANGYSQTYQSGGSQAAGWQGNSRTEWYGGNGAQWSSNRGHQRTCFFYDYNGTIHSWLNLGAQITKARLYIARGSGSGYGGARAVPFALHTTSLYNPPGNSSGNLYSPAVPENGGIWVDVPAHWAGHVIKQEHTGFMIGDDNSATYYANYPKADTGRLEVTIS